MKANNHSYNIKQIFNFRIYKSFSNIQKKHDIFHSYYLYSKSRIIHKMANNLYNASLIIIKNLIISMNYTNNSSHYLSISFKA